MVLRRSARRSERRERTRADARLSMRVEGLPEDGRLTQVVTESQNISASGVYCLSSHYLAPLSKVALTLVLPRMPGPRGAKELIKCEGIVVRCEPQARRGEKGYELACMFSDLDQKRREMLDEFVAWRNLQALRAAANRTAGGVRRSRPRAAARGATSAGTRTRRASGRGRRTVR